jgi:hypothetical protein
MGYKLLGFAVWQGAKWYLRKRVHGVRLKLVMAGLAAALVGGAVAASQRRSHTE